MKNIFFAIFLLLFITSCTQRELPQGMVFRYNESKDITSLDPAFASSQSSINACTQLFCGLLQLDEKLNVNTCISNSYNISQDKLFYTFSLRSDVFFHNHFVFPNGEGRRVVASDFVYSFYRLRSPQLASPAVWVMSPMDTCFAPNDSTLVIRLKYRTPVFLSTLTMPYCSVVAREAVEFFGKDFGKNPVGAGPFYLKQWRQGEKLVLRRHKKYFERDENGAPLPYLESVVTTFIPDKQSEFLEFAKGKVDYLSGVHPASRDELLTRSGALNPKYSGRVQLLQAPYLNTEYIGFLLGESDFSSSALQNEKLRKAIAHGVDKKKMIRFLRSNLATPAEQGFVPQGMPSFSEQLNGFSYNPQKAAQLLAEAGFAKGKNLPEITLSTTDDYLDICEFMQHELANLGIKISINVLSGAAYRQQLSEGKLAMFRASWIADYPDAESYLSLLQSKNFSPNGPNYTHFSSKIYDQIYERAMNEADEQKRFSYYRELDSLCLANAPIIPLFYDKVTRFVRAGITGMEPNAMNTLTLKKVKSL
ncbi:MAG: ABC transporter substrate-binding protein [Prevotellaceae bacterium]|jgi:peptide/nickel transport system substrate-binding protein|nr:ABC transporter substrate-binding protein [Prevotellaceae bacterium]